MDKKFNNFGAWLLYWRTEKRLSQAALGRMAGISKQHVSNLERQQLHAESGGISGASVPVIDKLAQALGRPLMEARTIAGLGLPSQPITEAIEEMKAEDESKLSDSLVYLFEQLSLPLKIEVLQVVLQFYQQEHPRESKPQNGQAVEEIFEDNNERKMS